MPYKNTLGHVRMSRFNSLTNEMASSTLNSNGDSQMSLKQFQVLSPKAILVLIVLVIAGCSDKPDPQAVAPPSNVAPPAAAAPVGPLPTLPPGKHAAMIADPNPIKVCDSSGLGITNIGITIERPVTLVDVRIGSPAGSQFATKTDSGFVPTGKWVTDGMVFYLQDKTGGKPLTPENTLATVTARVTSDGCP
jgi:hypothetical protein